MTMTAWTSKPPAKYAVRFSKALHGGEGVWTVGRLQPGQSRSATAETTPANLEGGMPTLREVFGH